MSKGGSPEGVENSTHTVLPLKGERRVLHPFTTEGRCGLTVRPGPVTSACTTLGFLPVPSSTLHLSAWSAKGEKVCLTKEWAPHRRGQCTRPVLNPPKAAPAFLGCCHLPHPVTCHIHFGRQGSQGGPYQMPGYRPTASRPLLLNSRSV